MLMTSPWKSSTAAEEGREYLALLLLYLPLEKLRAIPRFSWYTLLVVGQLRRSEGLIGYSLGAELGSLEFWSLSVWGDEESLRRFIHEAPHNRVIRSAELGRGQEAHGAGAIA